ncbi:MAG: glycosyl transferase family 4 [Gallionellales bacterium RIFOXYD2_FULL_52_7]|nr:MAG: glycosyl transferase family 4 [Gallionellales bacterium RIFOXYD2_FULL_52_7]
MLTSVILHGRLGKGAMDVPNERSLHQKPIPRIGGVALMAGVLSGWTLMFDVLTWWLAVPVLGLFAVSLLDDFYSLSVKKRLPMHLLAAAVLVWGSGLVLQHGWAVSLVVLLLTVWMTNLYNFMDGSDGLAGGMAVFGFIFYGLAAMVAHNDALAMLNFVVAAAALGFLFSNFHPARIFMGDAGSIPLGFLAAGMGLWGWQSGCWPVWFPVLVFSPFIVDASVTLTRRALRGAKITEAHREHYYQRAIQMGWGHRNVALVEYGLMLAVGVSALGALEHLWSSVALLTWVVIYTGSMAVLDMRWNKTKRRQDA